MAPTVHQRVNGWLWNWKTGPGWCRDGTEIAKLRNAAGNGQGMRVLKVQAQDNGSLPIEQVAEWNAAGMKVWLAVGHVDGRDPKELAAWLKAEKSRLTSASAKATISGWDCNFEEDVRALDANSNGQWSATFAAEARRLMPTLPLHIDTYFGSAAASPGINLGAYKSHGFRITVQSYWGANGLWNDPPTNMVKWLGGANPSWPKSIIKPLHRCVKNNEGKLPDWDVVFADQKASGCLGVGFYYIDGCDFDLLLWLVKESVKRGIAF